MSLAARWRPVLDFVLFQVQWCIAVLMGAAGHGGWVLVSACLVLAIHLGLCCDRGVRGREMLVIAIAGSIGSLADVVATQMGRMTFPGGAQAWFGLPIWMWALWFGFPIMLGTTLRWLSSRTWLAVALGAVGGPVSYFAGVRLGALQVAPPVQLGYLWIAVTWAVFTPAALALRSRLIGEKSTR